MTPTVAVCIPTIPPRRALLREALLSVLDQTHHVDEIVVATDVLGHGAGPTRNHAWQRASSDWIAFLDDDDTLDPTHVETLLRYTADADVIYSWFHLPTGADPLFVNQDQQLVPAFGVPFGDEQRSYLLTQGNFIPVTVLIRRAWLERVDGFPTPGTARWPHAECEDWGCWQDLVRAGARFKHVPERTWTWRWHGLNTSGKPWRR